MDNIFSKNYGRFVSLVWAMIMLLFWIQYLSMTTLWGATLFAACIFTPTVFITNYLSNKLLPKAVREKNMRLFAIQFIICSLLIALIHFTIFIIFYNLVKMEILEYSEMLILGDSLIVEYVTSIPACVIINLGFCGLRFYYEHTKLEEVHLKTQLQILQQQINPHFMFNVLNHIYILMQKDVGRASDLLVNYSEILRYQLYNGKKEYVTLGEEIQFLKDVIGVEKTRWGNELKVDCKWNIENEEIKIEPLILITFVENAFKHVSRSISETGYINISVEQNANNILMEVENSKSAKQTKKNNGSGLGLQNIKERLSILYPKKHELKIKENEQVYMIRLKITL